jgi:hypothetical protein
VIGLLCLIEKGKQAEIKTNNTKPDRNETEKTKTKKRITQAD